MERESVKSVVISFDFVSALSLLFIALKLCKVLTWSWFWVLSPIIFSVGLAILVGVVGLIIIIVIGASKW
jgi:hypothetical protein